MRVENWRRELAWLIGPIAAAALMFLVTAGVSQWMMARIDRESADMQANSLPSVRELSAARRDLTRIDTAAVDTMTGPPALKREALDVMQQRRDALDAHVESYSRTPWYPGERALYDRDLRPALEQLDVDIGRLVEMERNGVPPAERLPVEGAVVTDADRLDRSLADLIDLNHDQSYVAASSILDTRRTAMHVAVALDVMSLSLTAMLAVAALLAWRRLRAVQAQHTELVEARARELEAFGQRIAHDVLSPLAAVSFTLGSLERQNPSESTKLLVGRARSALGRSERLVRGIFDFARSGARPMPGARASLARVIHAAVDELAVADPQAPEVTIEHLDDCELPCDEGVLGVILANLLGNAAKYSKYSAVQRIVVRTRLVGTTRVHVEVEDFGPGIPSGLERSIFEPYVRAPGATQPGLGLGLATVHRLVGSHGGEVGVRRKEGGAIFWFELPCVRGEAVTSAPPPQGEPAPLH